MTNSEVLEGHQYQLSYNRHGYRPPEHTYDNLEGTFRIVVLGDSFTDGSEVGDEETFTWKLQQRLEGAEVIVYPTAIGLEPDYPDLDSQPMWRQTITANGLANGTFMVAINRFGTEGPLNFYGSSFMSDPYGRVLVEAPRDEPAVLVADLDLDQKNDWMTWGMYQTRRPDQYGRLTDPVE